MYDPRQVTLPPNPTLVQLSRLPQLALGYVGSIPSAIDRFFAEHGAPRRQTATAVGVAAVPEMVRRLPIVAILPDLIALDDKTRAALVIEPFAPGELSVKVSMVWHRRHEAGALAYVRGVLRELTGEGVHGVLR
jgi:DNA-binding transcriptional LysR family regulator